MRHLIVPLLVFVGFFVLFWNIRDWKLSVAEKVGLVFLCALGALIAASAVVWALITVFN